MIKKINNPKFLSAKFLIIPSPLPNELLSSWLVRTAYAHHTHPHTFMNLHFGQKYGYVFHNNIDISISNKDIEKILNKCRHKIDVKNLTLKTYETYLQEKIINNGSNKFLCDLRFCPLCLKEDPVVYFRKQWKIAFYTICQKHLCFLLTECPNCNTKIDISKMHSNTYSFKYCYKCKFELSSSHPSLIDSHLLQHLPQHKKLISALHNGYITFQKRPVYSFYFFDVLLQLTKKLLRNNKHKFFDFHESFQYLKSINKMRIKPIGNLITIQQQYILFTLLIHLFENYPYNFIEYIKANKLSHWQLTQDMDYVPFWYETLVNEISPQVVPFSKLVTDEEIEAAKKYLLANNIPINKANLTRLLGCNFFSSYNDLKERISH
ncbi:MAG: TniQ family protein [Thiovulaceae bacterium]|nr:TniQ family protein [Sulfurimonadaceae bacterium]